MLAFFLVTFPPFSSHIVSFFMLYYCHLIYYFSPTWSFTSSPYISSLFFFLSPCASGKPARHKDRLSVNHYGPGGGASGWAVWIPALRLLTVGDLTRQTPTGWATGGRKGCMDVGIKEWMGGRNIQAQKKANRWMKLNYFSISRILNGMNLDHSQPGKVLPSKVLMLNMCSFPAQLFKNTLRKSICSSTATYGNMLFSKCCDWNYNSSPLSIWIPSPHRSMSMNILYI